MGHINTITLGSKSCQPHAIELRQGWDYNPAHRPCVTLTVTSSDTLPVTQDVTLTTTRPPSHQHPHSDPSSTESASHQSSSHRTPPQMDPPRPSFRSLPHAGERQMEFNSNKCEVLHFGRTKQGRNELRNEWMGFVCCEIERLGMLVHIP